MNASKEKKKGYAERIAGVIAIFELQLAHSLSNVFIRGRNRSETVAYCDQK